MTSKNDDSTSATSDEQPVVLRDLQSLLRKSIGKDVIVVNYATKMLLPKGENYGSTILKVDAVIKKTKNAVEEKLPLVAKMIPTSEFQKSHFNITASFGKEMFVFEKLISTYRQLEEEAGVEQEALFDILPKYYGGRLALSEKTSHLADENAVMLMENLKERGYYTMDRMTGLDYEHAKLAMSELAHYHALGMAMKVKKPDVFEEAKEPMDVFPFDMKEDEFDDVLDHTIKLICEDDRIDPHKDRIRKSIYAGKGFEFFYNMEKTEPWVTISHGDFWVNNIMFRKDKGKLDVKFIDFQIARICSPLKDLPYFLLGSCRNDTVDEHFDDLLDIYYLKFLETLKRVDYDISPFTREGFDQRLKKDASSELLHCLMAIKFFTYEASNDLDLNEMKSSVMLSGANSQFFERSWRCVSKYIEKNWM